MAARYTLTAADQQKSRTHYSESMAARRMRRQAELALLDRLLAEAAMPEWYPHERGGE